MIELIKFSGFSAILLGLLQPDQDGFLYLRMMGNDVAVEAIRARLANRSYRGSKYKTEVLYVQPEQNRKTAAMNYYQNGICAYKSASYRTIRTRLDNNNIDVAVVHPSLTVAADNRDGFVLISHGEDEPPTGFWPRLNASLPVPIKQEWAATLWRDGQAAMDSWYLDDDGEPRRQHVKPISLLATRGLLSAWRVHTGPDYEQAWLNIIRRYEGLSELLYRDGSGHIYRGNRWRVEGERPDRWLLYRPGCDEPLLADTSMRNLLSKASLELGLSLSVEGGQDG